MRADRSSATEEATSPRPAAALPGAVKGEDMAKEEIFAKSSGLYIEDLGDGGVAISDGGDFCGNAPAILMLSWMEVDALADALQARIEERCRALSRLESEAPCGEGVMSSSLASELLAKRSQRKG